MQQVTSMQPIVLAVKIRLIASSIRFISQNTGIKYLIVFVIVPYAFDGILLH